MDVSPNCDCPEKEKAEDPAPDNAASDEKTAQTVEIKPETAPRRPSSLRDEINEALGVKPEVAETKETPEPEVTRELKVEPEKSKKPTLDDIFGEKK